MRLARWLVAAAFFSSVQAPAYAQVQMQASEAGTAKPKAEIGQPRLVIAISVDQFSSDLFAEWRRTFSGGLKRMAQGVVFPSGYQSHAATETCPGHATITSGVRPGRAGIAANDWFGMRGKNLMRFIASRMKMSPQARMTIIRCPSSI